MAAASGRTDHSLAANLYRVACEFDFFQAVRLLRLLYPDKRFNHGLEEPVDQLIRFRAKVSMGFPPSAVESIEDNDDGGGPADMTVSFMGLTGPQGVLPSHYTELMIARKFDHDATLRDFLDIFNHRLISLFYWSWEKHCLPILFEKEAAARRLEDGRKQGREQRGFTQYLSDLIGMGTPGLARDDLPVAANTLLQYCGLLGQRPRSASALAGLLRDYFQVAVEVDQFVGQWFRLDDADCSYLSPDGPRNTLGLGAIAGDEVWNSQARFRIKIGPVRLKRFRHFLPDGKGFHKLVFLTNYFVDRMFEFDVQLILQAEDVPACRLGDGPGAPQLGWSSWLKTDSFETDAGDVVLSALDA